MESQVLGNVSSTYSWIPNPTTRGSSNILQSCIITIGLCVWSAVHLNIPKDKQPIFAGLCLQTWRKMAWIILGLLAPELLIYTAWCQRVQAIWFMKAYNKAFDLTPPESALKKWVCQFLEALLTVVGLSIWRAYALHFLVDSHGNTAVSRKAKHSTPERQHRGNGAQ